MKIIALVLLLVLLIPSATAQWTTQEIHDFTGDETNGVGIEVHPITNNWVIVYGHQNITDGQTRVESTNDEFTTSTAQTVWTSTAENALTNAVGGISTSMTGLAFCLMETKSNGTANDNDLFLFYNTQISNDTTAGPTHKNWDFNRITDDFVLAGACSTSLPRYGWRAPPGAGLAWVKDPDGETTADKSVFVQLNSRAEFTRGPYQLGGEFSIGLDSMEFTLVPGFKYESPNYVGSPDKQPTITETACSNAGFSLKGAISALGCLSLKVTGFVAKVVLAGFGARGGEDPTIGKDTVDLHTSATGVGLSRDPVTQHQVNFATHSFLREENDQLDPAIFANRPGLSLRASDTTIMEPYNSMVIWHDQDSDEVRYRIAGTFDATGTSHTAFSYEPTIQHIRIKAVDPTPRGQGDIIVGALYDRDNTEIQAFWTTDRGQTWTNETIATDAFDVANNLTVANPSHLVDVAYDPTREKLLVTYPTDTNITLATRDLSFEPSPIANPSDLRGLLDDTGTTPPTQEFLGIDLNPIGESSGLGIDGGKMFLALLLILGMMGGTFAIARDGRLCVWIGGGAGLITSLATGLIGTWVLLVTAVFFFGLGQAVHLLDRGADIVRGESLG